ncbi:MAG: SAM-dependent chlorinase/fluorinase [Chloroflexi bacterium]|nr:SAM-dependent chlorinase/fluorinase [Chloroflexota bacterium]
MTPAAGRPAILTLLTDFGASDAYVGAMKGVMLGVNPALTLVDLTHQVAPQNVLEGAFLLGAAWRFFPQGAIHLAVVDPGVGTQRVALLIHGEGHYFLAPDNGLLSFVLPQSAPRRSTSSAGKVAPFQPYQSPVPPGLRAYALTNPRYWLPQVSSTFHGRDIFAAAAAHLSLGVPMEELGAPVQSLTRLRIPAPLRDGARLTGCVLHVDRFGNIVTSMPAEALAGMGRDVMVEVGGRQVRGLVETYGEGKGLVALIGSHGYLEVALAGGNAARELGVGVGAEVRVRRF